MSILAFDMCVILIELMQLPFDREAIVDAAAACGIRPVKTAAAVLAYA